MRAVTRRAKAADHQPHLGGEHVQLAVVRGDGLLERLDLGGERAVAFGAGRRELANLQQDRLGVLGDSLRGHGVHPLFRSIGGPPASSKAWKMAPSSAGSGAAASGTGGGASGAAGPASAEVRGGRRRGLGGHRELLGDASEDAASSSTSLDGIRARFFPLRRVLWKSRSGDRALPRRLQPAQRPAGPRAFVRAVMAPPRSLERRLQPAQRPAGPRAGVLRGRDPLVGVCAEPSRRMRSVAARLRRAVPAEAGVPSRGRDLGLVAVCRPPACGGLCRLKPAFQAVGAIWCWWRCVVRPPAAAVPAEAGVPSRGCDLGLVAVCCARAFGPRCRSEDRRSPFLRRRPIGIRRGWRRRGA